MADIEFTDFVRVHTPALLRSAFLLTKDSAAAQDLVQDTFVRLHPKWLMVANAAVPEAYVRRAMVNNFLNSTRGRSSQEQPAAHFPDRADDSDLAGRVTDRVLVAGLLNSLSPRQRAVLVLKFFHDLADSDIASEVGCRKATVRSVVHRGLAALRAEIERSDHPTTAPAELKGQRP